MRYVIPAIVLAMAVTAAACGGGDGATPTSTANSRAPQRLGAVPEGILLVQEKEPSGSPRTFALEGGDVRQLSKGPWLEVSPDGERAALVEAAGDTARWAVRVVDAQGEQMFEAKAPKGSTLSGSPQPEVRWSADGSRLAYTLPAGEDGGLSRVYTVAADGTDRRQVSEAAGHYSLIAWAGDAVLAGEWADDPSGTPIASRLLLMGSGVRELAVPPGTFQFWSFAPSPDGRRVAFYAGSPEAMEVWVAEAESGQARKVASAGVARRSGAGLYVSAGAPLGVEAPAPAKMKGPPPLAWSPDGRRLAYYRNEGSAEGAFSSELRVVEVATGVDALVAEEGSWGASWSPDGRYLAEGSGRLRLLGPDGAVREVDVFATAASWSPGGKLIAGSEIGTYVVQPDTGAAREVRRPDGKALGTSGLAAWSPSGRYVAVSDPWGLAEGSVYLVDVETAEASVLLEGSGFWPVAWMRLTADEGTD